MQSRLMLVGTGCVCLLIAIGCSQQPTSQSAAAPTTPSAATSTIAKPEVSINAVMVALVDHAGHALWDVEREGKAPKTEADWELVEEHAIQLAAAGPAVTVGGTGPSDAVWVQSADWHKYAQAMSDAGTQAVAAAKSKNYDALVAANGKLVESCENCHKQFKPALPTEGITHAHGHPAE